MKKDTPYYKIGGVKSKHETPVETLLGVKKILDENNINIIPMFGTLLGFVRDDGIMEHDDDADFVAHYKDQPKIVKLANEFYRNGYELKGSGLKYRYRHLSIISIGRNDFHIDIVFIIKDVNCYVISIYPDNNVICRIIKKYGLYNSRVLMWMHRRLCMYLWVHKLMIVFKDEWFEDLMKINIYGKDFLIPRDYHGLLRSLYGYDWRKSVKVWSKKIAKKYGIDSGVIVKKYKPRSKELKNLIMYRGIN